MKIGAVPLLAGALATFAIASTLHLLALSAPDNRAARAYLGMGW